MLNVLSLVFHKLKLQGIPQGCGLAIVKGKTISQPVYFLMITQDDNKSSGLCLTTRIQQLDRRAEPKVQRCWESRARTLQQTDRLRAVTGIRQSQISLRTFIEIV